MHSPIDEVDAAIDSGSTIDAVDARPLHERLAAPALALGSGALVALSLPPWGFWPLALIGIALFGVVLDGCTTTRQRRRRGWLFGAGWMYLGMGWMVQLTVPGYLVAAAIFAALHGLAAWISPTGRWAVIGRPTAHTLVEALRFSFPFGGVPLASLGISQVSGPFATVARVGGVILIAWLVFQIGFVASRPELLRRRSPQALVGAIAAVAVVLVSFVAPTGSPTGETLRIAAVQGGGEQGTRALDVPSIEVTQRHLEATATIDPDPELDLVFWPENTMDVIRFEGSEIAALVTAQAARLDVPISVGLTEDVITDDGGRRFTNAQVIVTPDGEITSRYDKVRRVPFGEYVPLRGVIEKISSAVDQIGDAVAGTTPAYLDLPTGERLSTVISWEVFFGGRAREGVALGAQAILNPTNGASYTGTIVQTQQVASSRLRAIETGRWVVQAAPTGFTAFVSPDGEVVERSSQREQTVIVGDVELRSGNTWYVSLGDRPFIILLLLVLTLSLWMSIRAARDERLDESASDDPAADVANA